MSGRLAGYAAEIERYLRGAAAVEREELDDDKSATSARREASEFRAMKSYPPEPGRPPDDDQRRWHTRPAR